MRHFVKQNWVANFANFISFDPLTFPLVTLVLHHQLEQSSRLSSCISSCILIFFSFFSFLFLIFFVGSKVSNNICLFFTMLTKQILIKVLHSELLKKKNVCWSCWVIHPSWNSKDFFLKKNDLIIMGDLLFLNFKNWFIFTGTCLF